MPEREGSPEPPLEDWQIQLEELEALAQKELSYLEAEGISPETEQERLGGKAQSGDEILEDLNRGMEAYELQERKQRIDDLGPEFHEILGTIRHLYADIKHRFLKLPGTPELVENSDKTAEAWEDIQVNYRTYELGHLTKEKLFEAMQRTFEAFVEIEHRINPDLKRERPPR